MGTLSNSLEKATGKLHDFSSQLKNASEVSKNGLSSSGAVPSATAPDVVNIASLGVLSEAVDNAIGKINEFAAVIVSAKIDMEKVAQIDKLRSGD